jgi:HEAT repeat protein
VNFSLGRRIGRDNRTIWNADDPNLDDELLFSIREEAVSFLKSVETPEQIITVAQIFAENSKSPYAQQAAAYMLARIGNSQAAVGSIEKLIKLLVTGAPWEGEIAARARMLKSLLLSDPVAAKERLTEWEAETVQNLGLMETKLAKLKGAKELR